MVFVALSCCCHKRQIQETLELSPGGGQGTNGSSSPLFGTDVWVGSPCDGNLVSPALSELPTELKVFADVEVSDGLCAPDDGSTGEDGAFGSCSLVFFFFKNPRVGIDALVRGGGKRIRPGQV